MINFKDGILRFSPFYPFFSAFRGMVSLFMNMINTLSFFMHL